MQLSPFVAAPHPHRRIFVLLRNNTSMPTGRASLQRYEGNLPKHIFLPYVLLENEPSGAWLKSNPDRLNLGYL